MKVTAKLNYLHISPRKVRTVVDALRHLSVNEALARLNFMPKRSAMPLLKLMRSAIANAEHNFYLDKDSLKIAIFKVDGGPVFKRARPGSRGRVAPIKKRTSHITLILEGNRQEKEGLGQHKHEVNTVAERKTSQPQKSEIKKESNLKLEKVKKFSNPNLVKRMFRRKSV